MILSERYPHIFELVSYYADSLDNETALAVLESGLDSEETAKAFSYFIWQMVDQIHADFKSGELVLGSKDNRTMLPDLSYEVSTFMEVSGHFDIGEDVSDSI